MAEYGITISASTKALFRKIKNAPKRLRAIKQALIDSAEVVLDSAKTEYLSGKALNIRSGDLRDKTHRTGVEKSGDSYQIHVVPGMKYGIYWEEGFYHKSGVYMEPRKWLYPSFEDNESDIRSWLNDANKAPLK